MRGYAAKPLAARAAFFMSAIDTFQHIWWDEGTLYLLDQRRLPAEELIVRCRILDDVIDAIKTMQVRGAPAIGCTAAYGMALVAQQSAPPNSSAHEAAETLGRLEQAKQRLDAARPTAVNLAWATGRILNIARQFVD